MGLAQFVGLLLRELDRRLDKRLVRTFLQTLTAIVMLRDRANGLLLSELGGYLESPDKAPAGTKRLSHLLHASKWSAWLIGQFLWQRASRQVAQWQEQGEVALALWDESEDEKPETVASDDLSAVRVSQSGASHPHQARVLHPAGQADLCTRLTLAGRDRGGLASPCRSPGGGGDAAFGVREGCMLPTNVIKKPACWCSWPGSGGER